MDIQSNKFGWLLTTSNFIMINRFATDFFGKKMVKFAYLLDQIIEFSQIGYKTKQI